MNDVLRDLYEIPEHIVQQDIYLLDLREQCCRAERRVQDIMEGLSDTQRHILEEYIYLRDELEFQSVKQALRLRSRLHVRE